MNKATKRGSALWIIISIISLLCAAGLLFIMLQEREKRIQSEEELAVVEKEKSGLKTKVESLSTETDKLKEKARLLSEEFKREKEKYQAELEEQSSRLNSLTTSLANEKKHSANLAANLAQLKENYESLQKQHQLAEQKSGELKSQLDKLSAQKGVELKKIVVKQKPKPLVKGRILVVNNEFNFVVIDLGQKDDINVEDEFAVLRAGRQVGKVKIERVYEAMSTAAIVPGSEEDEIIEDSVVQSL